MTPPIDTIRFAELPAGTKGVAPIRRVKSVVDPLKELEISVQTNEFPSGKSPEIDAESAGVYPRAFVTSALVSAASVPPALRKLVAVAPLFTLL
jgi:hypothetical protein